MAAGDFIHGRLISLDNCVSPASPTPGIAGSRAVAAGAGVLMSCHIEPDINYLENQVSYKNSTLRHCVLFSCQKPATEVRSSFHLALWVTGTAAHQLQTTAGWSIDMYSHMQSYDESMMNVNQGRKHRISVNMDLWNVHTSIHMSGYVCMILFACMIYHL